jgi:hypothetical protein
MISKTKPVFALKLISKPVGREPVVSIKTIFKKKKNYFHIRLGEPQENTLGEPLAFPIYIYIYIYISFYKLISRL